VPALKNLATRLRIESIRATTTDDGSALRLSEILRWADGYVAQLRERCAAASVDREAENGASGSGRHGNAASAAR
jgi:hypothetical protein